MILIPATTFIVSWQKQNLLDTSTYYVRAVITRALTGEVLATLNLDDVNGNSTFFQKSWNVPPDPGYGLQVLITKTVYDDSAYTQVSGVYGAWQETFTILDIAKRSGGNTGGSGGGTDYALVREIVKKITKEVIEEAISNIKPPQPTDLSPVLMKMNVLSDILQNKMNLFMEIAQKSKTLEEVQQKMKSSIDDFNKIIANTKESVDTSVSEMTQNNIDEMYAANGRFQNEFSQKVEEELSYVIAQFRKNVQDSTNEMKDELNKTIAENLSKPIQIQTVAPKEIDQKPKIDSRVSRLLGNYV